MKKTITLFVVLLVLLTNCEKDTIQSENRENNKDIVVQNIVVEHVAFEELRENENLASVLNGISSAFDVNIIDNLKKSGSIVVEYENNFTILTDKILKIATDTTEAYTFRIKQPTKASSSFENFVIQRINNNYKFYIYRYKFDGKLKDEAFPYKMTRKRVNNDQINLGDFHDFLKISDIPDGCYDAYCIKNPRTFECDWILDPTDCPGGSGTGSNDNEGDNENDSNPYNNDDDNNYGGGNQSNNEEEDDEYIPIAILDEACGPGKRTDGSGNCVTEDYFDDQIFIEDEFKDEPCLKDVYDAMGKATKFQEYINNFGAGGSVANLRFAVGVHPAYPNATAVTDEPENYLIKITFNPNTLNRPKLDIARTMIHEMIHAEMYRKLLSIAKKPNIPWTAEFIHSLKDSYEGLADYYTRYWLDLPLDQQPGHPQHEQMAEHFRGIIEQALRDYDSSLSDLQYEAIAWVGLKGGNPLDEDTGLPPIPTAAWESVPKTERLLLNSTYEDYKDNTPNCQ